MNITMSSVLEEIDHANQIILALVFIFGGCVVMLWGSKLFKQILFLLGFVAGTLFTYFLLKNHDLIHTSLRVHLLISSGVGVFIGALCVFVYKMAVFTTGSVAGLIVSQFVWKLFVTHFPDSFLMQNAELYSTLWIIAFSLLSGFLAFKFMDIALRAITAFIGSFMVSSGLTFFVARYVVQNDANLMSTLKYFKANDEIKISEGKCSSECYVAIAVWAALFLSGLLYQYHCSVIAKCSKKRPKGYEEIVPDYADALNAPRTSKGYVEIV